jgi:hypothetical protein
LSWLTVLFLFQSEIPPGRRPLWPLRAGGRNPESQIERLDAGLESEPLYFNKQIERRILQRRTVSIEHPTSNIDGATLYLFSSYYHFAGSSKLMHFVILRFYAIRRLPKIIVVITFGYHNVFRCVKCEHLWQKSLL